MGTYYIYNYIYIHTYIIYIYIYIYPSIYIYIHGIYIYMINLLLIDGWLMILGLMVFLLDLFILQSQTLGVFTMIGGGISWGRMNGTVLCSKHLWVDVYLIIKPDILGAITTSYELGRPIDQECI